MSPLVLLLAVIRVGVIGLDTSHSTAFTRHLNVTREKPLFEEFRVTHAVLRGSSTLERSLKIQAKKEPEMRAMGVEIVPDVDTLLRHVDVVLLETNDGREHRWQAEKCFKAKKRVFIDKPLAHDLADSVAIVELAKKYGATFFTSSALRYVNAIRDVKEKGYRVRGMDCWTCYNTEPSHEDWYWYGIHAVDPLFAVLGRGCEEVTSFSSTDGAVAVGRWKDGRFGIARGLSTAKRGAPYGGAIFAEDAKVDWQGNDLVLGHIGMGTYEGYAAELEAVLGYFKTGVAPVDPEESLEVMAFMSAAGLSARRRGQPVRPADLLAEARQRWDRESAAAEADERFRWFDDAKLGLFIHRGLRRAGWTAGMTFPSSSSRWRSRSR